MIELARWLLVAYLFFSMTLLGYLISRSVLRSISNVTHLVIGIVVGPVVLIGCLYLLTLVLSTWAYWLLFVGLILFPLSLFWCRQEFGQSLHALLQAIKKWPLVTLWAVFSSLTLAASISFSWLELNDGSLFFQQGVLHDMVWHVALANKLLIQIPPEHPSTINLLLSNYHYSLDLLVAMISFVSKLPVHSIFFQIIPWIISAQLGLMIILIARQIERKRWAFLASWALFFIFFGGSFAYLLPLIGIQNWTESSFWVSQTFAVMVNPQLIVSFSVVLLILFIEHEYVKKPSQPLLILIISMIAIVAGIKFYALVFGIVSLGITLIFFIAKQSVNHRKKIHHILLGLIYFIVVGVIFILPFVGNQKVQLFYAPMWFPKVMVAASDRVPIPSWAMYEQEFFEKGNWPQYIKLKFFELVVFVCGNLGTRIIAFFIPILFIIQRLFKKTAKFEWNFFPTQLWVLSMVGLILPLLFLQTGYVWNTIQFWYYTLIFFSILAAIACLKMSYLAGPRRWSIIAILIVVLTLPTYIQTTYRKYFQADRIDATITTSIPQSHINSILLICPSSAYSHFIFDTSLIQAISPQNVFLADPSQLEIIGENGDTKSKIYKDGEFERLKNQNQITIGGVDFVPIVYCPTSHNL